MSDSSVNSPLPPQIRSPHNPRVLMAKTPFELPPLPLGWDEITKILPHRYPFLLVDKITQLEPGHRIVGVKNVTATEEFFQGHFPGHPVMPGVLLLESMAQIAGILILTTRNTPGALSYFAEVNEARFRQPVRPGDSVITEATLDILRGPIGKATVVGRVDGVVVVEGKFTFMTTNAASAKTIVKNASLAVQNAAPSTPRAESASNGVVSEPKTEIAPAANKIAAPKTEETKTEAPKTEAPKSAAPKAKIHPFSVVEEGAILAEGVEIGPFCVVEGGTSIGKNTVLQSHVVVKRGTSIGEDCVLFPNVVVGGAPQDGKFKGEESFVKIGDRNTLREGVTIHRATGEGNSTIIGNDNMLMVGVHFGHNCVVGSNNMVSNSTGVSGHVTIEDRCVIGGFVGVHQNVRIGKMAMVGGLSKVVQDVPPFCTADGRPARIRGLNTKGLRRNKVTSQERAQISEAFKLLYRDKNLNTTQALEKVRAEIPSSETLEYLLSFIERIREGQLGRQDETPN